MNELTNHKTARKGQRGTHTTYVHVSPSLGRFSCLLANFPLFEVTYCRNGSKFTFSNTWHKNNYALHIEKSGALFCWRLVQYGLYSAAVGHLPFDRHAHNFATWELCAIHHKLRSLRSGNSLCCVWRLRRVGTGKVGLWLEGKGSIYWPPERGVGRHDIRVRSRRTTGPGPSSRRSVKYLEGRKASSPCQGPPIGAF